MTGQDPQVRQRVGRFELVDELGSGAFGTVYLGRDSQLGRDVALKIPREGVFQSSQEAERFIREARAAAGLQHPNICPVFDIVDHDGVPVIVMGYLQGRRLDQVIGKQRVSQRQAAGIVRSLAKTLHAAHQQGVVHRDLKPANIMIDAVRREPVIMDFGLARIGAAEDSQLTRTGQILGSPAYMSPEQANADLAAIGTRSDIYSLGVILYELLCGQRPFDGSVGEVLAALLYTEPPRPSQRRASVDPELERICLTAMAKTLEQRYATMNELARDLSRWLKSPAAEGGSVEGGAEVGGSDGSLSTSSDASQSASAAGLSVLPGDGESGSRSSRQLASGGRAGGGVRQERAGATETAAIKAAAADTSLDQPGGASLVANWGRRWKQHTSSRRARLILAAATAALCAVIVIIVVVRESETPPLVTGLEKLRATPTDPGELNERAASGVESVVGQTRAASKAKTGVAAVNEQPTGEVVNEAGTRLLHTWTPGGSRVRDVTFSPDGRWVATANEIKSASVWDVASGQLVDTIRDFESAVLCVAFSPDGRYLATGTSNQASSQRGVASLWSTTTWRREASFSDSKAMRSLAFTPDGTRVIGGLGSSVPEASVVQMEGRFRPMQERMKKMDEQMKKRAADQGRAAPSSFVRRGFTMWQWGGLAIYDRASDKSLPTPELDTSRIVEVAMSPDGKQFATCGFRGELKLRDADTGEVLIDLLSPTGQPGGAKSAGTSGSTSTAAPVHAVAFAPVGSVVAAGSPDGFFLYDVSARREVLRNSTAGETLAIQFSPDGRILATGHERQPIQLWDAVSGERLQTIPVSWQWTLDIEFHPDGKLLVASGESPGAACVWSIR